MLHGGFVTTFGKRRAPQHPGGDVIYTNAGKDATALFESYHGPSARFAQPICVIMYPSFCLHASAVRRVTNVPFFLVCAIPYHANANSRVLQKYYIGPLQRQPGDANDIVDFDHGDDEFYAIVKQRVRQYFRCVMFCCCCTCIYVSVCTDERVGSCCSCIHQE